MAGRLREAFTVHKEKEERAGNIEMVAGVRGLLGSPWAYEGGTAEESYAM